LKKSRRPVISSIAEQVITGVRCATPAIVVAARCTDLNVTSEASIPDSNSCRRERNPQRERRAAATFVSR
jgi:hypothetical protein